jgi:hypothetical protein
MCVVAALALHRNNHQSINVLSSIISTNFRRESHTLIDLDVLDDEVAGVETLGVGVGLGVLEETEEEFSGLDGPASPGDTEGLAYCSCLLASMAIMLDCDAVSKLPRWDLTPPACLSVVQCHVP